jgi:hypothetical protein
VKTSISQKDKLRQVRLAICETRRQVAAMRLESIAGCDNPYSLVQVFGRGHLTTKEGASKYVTQCLPVSVTPRAVVNSTAEIPVSYNRSNIFVDTIFYVIRPYGSLLRCTDIAAFLDWRPLVLSDSAAWLVQMSPAAGTAYCCCGDRSRCT